MPCLEAVQQAEEEAGKEAVAGVATVACVLEDRLSSYSIGKK